MSEERKPALPSGQGRLAPAKRGNRWSTLAKGLFFVVAAPLACALTSLTLVVAVQAATGSPVAADGLSYVDDLASSYGFELALVPTSTPTPTAAPSFTPAPPTSTAFAAAIHRNADGHLTSTPTGNPRRPTQRPPVPRARDPSITSAERHR
jgi:hypothetical protein